MEDRDKWELVLEMVKTPSWRVFVDDMQNQRNALNDISLYDNEQSIWYARGQADVLDNLLNLQTTLEAVIGDQDESL